MSICPYCQEIIQIPEYAENNVRHYQRSATTKTDCCGHAVRLIPYTGYNLEPSKATEDDWGHECKPVEDTKKEYKL